MSKNEYRRRDFTPGPCYLPPDADASRDELEAAAERAAVMAGGPEYSHKVKRDAFREALRKNPRLTNADLVALRKSFEAEARGNGYDAEPAVSESYAWAILVNIALDRWQWICLVLALGLSAIALVNWLDPNAGARAFGEMWITGGL